MRGRLGLATAIAALVALTSCFSSVGASTRIAYAAAIDHSRDLVVQFEERHLKRLSSVEMEYLLRGDAISAHAGDAQTPATLYAGAVPGGVFKSANGGRSWGAVNAGLTVKIVSALAIDPQKPTTIYAGTFPDQVSLSGPGSRGVFKSTDGGRSWRKAGLGRMDVFDLAIDPWRPATVYASNEDGVFKSTDGGRRWRAVNVGLVGRPVEALAIDPQKPTTIYAGTGNLGVFKSVDGGRRWLAMSAGLGRKGVWALAIDPQTPATVYAGTERGPFKSTDGGRTWQAVNAGLRYKDMWALAIDPERPATVYAGADAEGIYGEPKISASACIKSTDGGRSWKAVKAGLGVGSVSDLAIDPRRPATVYAGTDEGVFKTTDGGRRWRAVNKGLSRKNVWTLATGP